MNQMDFARGLLSVALLLAAVCSNSHLSVTYGADRHESHATADIGMALSRPMAQSTCQQGVSCPPRKKDVVTYGNITIRKPKRDDEICLPYIVYPRRTLILDVRPTLVWHDTEPPYTVSITKDGETIWRQTGVMTNSITYPKGEPALVHDALYLLVVEDSAGKTSRDDPEKGLGFRVLSERDRKDIEQQSCVAASRAMKPSEKAALALAWCYANWRSKYETNSLGLWGPALLNLREYLEKNPETKGPWVWNRVGDLQLMMAGFGEATTAYRRALDEARRPEKKEGWVNLVSRVDAWALGEADALTGLWHSTRQTMWLEDAIKVYEKLGNEDAVRALTEEAAEVVSLVR